MLREVVIRPVSPSDRAELRAMYEGFEPRPASLGLPPASGVDRWLEGLNAAIHLIAVADDTAIGHGLLCAEGDSGEVAVFVRQEFRVQGIGRRLLDALIDEARKRGLRSIWGITELDNVPMLRLAHAAGFVQDAEDPARFFMILNSSAEAAEPAARAKRQRR
jgi:GNAT superfamily N-acetyltransferase